MSCSNENNEEPSLHERRSREDLST